MKLILPNILKKLYEHGIESYPKEACGFIFSCGDINYSLNIQDQLHQKDPTIYPRNATTGYSMSIKDTKILESSFKTINPAICIYHSHPDVGAYFSKEDSDKALFMNELIYNVDYLVLDINQGKALEAKQFSFVNNEFICVATYNSEGKIIN